MGIYSDAHLGFGWKVKYPDWDGEEAASEVLDEWLREHGRGYLGFASTGHYEDPEGQIIWFLVKSATFYRADCWDHNLIAYESFMPPREKNVQRAAEEANEFLEHVGDEQRIDYLDARWLLGAAVG